MNKCNTGTVKKSSKLLILTVVVVIVMIMVEMVLFESIKFPITEKLWVEAIESVDDTPHVTILNIAHAVPKDTKNIIELEYIIENPDFCRKEKDIYIISYVHSAITKTVARQLIRDSWGNYTYFGELKLKVFFVFGKAETDAQQEIVDEEHKTYGDIVQTDYHDSYRNLSYKGVTALKWISEHCMKATWILKTDDDMLVNSFALISFLKTIQKSTIKDNPEMYNRFMCAVWNGMPVLRGEPKSCAKWCVSKEEWNSSYYPTYCSGSAFIVPVAAAPKLYTAYYSAPFLWVDDAYISGVLAKEANVKHLGIYSLYEMRYEGAMQSLVFGNKLFCHHPGRPEMREKIWKLILKKEGKTIDNI